MKKVLFTALLLPLLAGAAEVIALPAPQKTGGLNLYEALDGRRSVRKFAPTPLTAAQLSQVLWCANGRSAAGKRTAPSAVNRQEIDVYCLLPDGAYLYDAAAHWLVRKTAEDLRPAGRPAPCYLLLVADAGRQFNADFGKIDAGYVSQNLYLVCRSLGLGTCAMGTIRNREVLRQKLNLGESQLLLVHPVGIPE